MRETLRSVAKQTFSAYQCYVVDDCSTDDTVAMIKNEFNWVHMLGSNKRNGPSKNRNLAIALGNAPFVVTLDDDVALSPDWLKEMVDFISFSPAIGAVGSQLRFWHSPDTLNGIGGFFGVDGVGGDLFFNTSLDEVQSLIERPIRVVYACTAAMIMRRGAFEEAGRFDASYFYLGEDFDLGLRMNFRGYLVLYNPRAIAYHRYHTTARTFQRHVVDYLYYRNSLLTILKNFSTPTIAKMLPRFFQRLRSDPYIGLKAFAWNLFHLGNILAWRWRRRKRQSVTETQILSLNSFLLALLFGKSGLQHDQAARVSWKWRLLRALFRVYVLINRSFQGPEIHPNYVDNIIFQVTNICNARCKQCFLRHVLNRDVGKNLSLDEIRKFFTSLGRVNNIVLGGGEPFLRKDLDQVCVVLDRLCGPSLITIPTNGAYPDIIFQKAKSILENTRASLKISLSIDGPPWLHDNIRGVPNLFDKVHQTYEKLLFLYRIFYPRLSLQVNSTVFAENYEYFPNLYHLVKERFPFAQFTFETIRGYYDTNLAQPITDDIYQDLIESVRQLGDSRMTNHLELHCLALDTIKQQRQVVPCNAGRNFVVLDFFGNLYPCEILPAFVNIRDIGYDFARVVEDPRWKKIIDDVQNGKCHCTHMCFLNASFGEFRSKGRKNSLFEGKLFKH